MTFTELGKRICFLLSVPTCTRCNQRLDFDDKALCKACKTEYLRQKQTRCSVCNKELPFCSCSLEYIRKHYVLNLTKLFRYDDTEESKAGNSLIYSLKSDYRRDVVDFLAEEIADSINNCNIIKEDKRNDYIVTNLPRRRKAIINTGYDHAAFLAKRVAKKLGLTYVKLLVSEAKHEQKKSKGREDRLKNAKYEYKKNLKIELKGKYVILIDDVLTSGASMSAGAMLIHGLGAKRIIGSTISIAAKDDYRPFKRPEF